MTELELRESDVRVDGLRLRVYETGNAGDQPILWLHGSGPGVSSLSNWQALITSMPGYHHIAPDVPGFGESEHLDPMPRGIPASAAARSEVLLHLLDTMGIEKTHVVGNSMGGMYSLRMVLTAPERFDRMVLMGSGGAPIPPTPDLVTMVQFYDDPTEAAMLRLIGRFVYNVDMFGDTVQQIATDRVAKATREHIKAAHLATFDPAGGALVYSDEELASIQHETLVVHGREDNMIPFAAGTHFASRIPNAQLHVFPNAGHWVQVEQVARFRTQAQVFFGEGKS